MFELGCMYVLNAHIVSDNDNKWLLIIAIKLGISAIS